MTLLDSNLIVYSINNSSPKQSRAQEYIIRNSKNLCLSHQNILESIRVLTHPKFVAPMRVEVASRAVWAIASSLTLIAPNIETIFVFREFIGKYRFTGNKIFDAYLVATAMTNGVFSIATDNINDFRKFEEISVINPFLVE